MKPLKTKAQIREEIEKQINEYLTSGGDVEEVPSGVSGNTDNTNLFSHSTSFEPKKERTPLTDVVKALDERKKPSSPTKNKTAKPKKKLITDDFGEPVRWIWQD